jgi:Polyketide cyclase / dehydrase and lipid transport
MPTQTVTRSVESDLEPDKLYNVLAEATNIPKWAPVFADSIERIDHVHHRVTKNGEVFNLEVSLHPSAVAVDYTREMSNGRRGGAYIRVMPRPLGGSTITMTVPIGANTTEADVGKVLEQELADLLRLSQL